jgi:Flp pilus assembly protein TadG
MPDDASVSRARRRWGSAALELSLFIPILVSLFVGTWTFGYSFFLYSKLVAGVRAGARYASVTVYDAANTAAYKSAVRNVVVYGSPAAGAKSVVPNLTTAHVTVAMTPAVGAPAAVTVAISGYKLAIPVTLNGKPSLRMPFLGNYVP